MAKYKMLVGTIIYYEIPMEANSPEEAKQKMNNAFSHMDGSWNSMIDEAIGQEYSTRHMGAEYHGIKECSLIEIQETVVG